MDMQFAVDTLCKAGITFVDGLTSNELNEIEARYSFTFPPDLREFLSYTMPVGNSSDNQYSGKGFVNWRDDDEKDILVRLSWPVEGVLLDVQDGRYWIEEWGNKPDNLESAVESVKIRARNAPKLIPIYSHRYIPDTPNKSNNPVLSVMQTDIIPYGANLWNYFEQEFRVDLGTNIQSVFHFTNKIEFWEDIVFNN